MPERMHALTIWQPWASLIVEGAKPYEFRGWSLPRRLIGQRVAIHAGARPMRLAEVRALLIRISGNLPWQTGLTLKVARPILEGCRIALEPKSALADLFTRPHAITLPLSSILGTAILGEPTKNPVIDGHHLIEDSDRAAHLNWGWPMLDIERFDVPVPARGAQGFWIWERIDA